MQTLKLLIVAATLLLLGVQLAFSQTTFASITGSVADSSGALVPGATITVTNLETNTANTVKSNEAGVYTVAQIKEGKYSLRAQAAGFKGFVVREIDLTARDIRRIDVVLEVGAVETSVEVSGGATLIETETARISDTRTAGMLKTLPMNSRSIWLFLALSPNVLQASGISTVRFAGSKSNQAHWAIDGTTISDGSDDTQIGPLANFIESFQEIKIEMANNTAEFNTIGQVTMISKSGTNKLHGTVFDYYSTPWFRARDPFSVARTAGIAHTPGGGVGGPVWLPKIYDGRNRTFFFASFETTRGSAVTDQLTPSVPLAAWRQGDFSALPVKIYDPTNGQPFAGNRIPADRINPVSKAIQERFYPLPNFGDPSVFSAQNYREEKIRPADTTNYWTARGDHRFSDADSIFGRFTFLRAPSTGWDGNLPTLGMRGSRRDDRAATISHSHIFRPTLLNEFRWGFVLNNFPRLGPLDGLALVKDLGLVGLAPDLPDIKGILNISWSGVALQGLSQTAYRNPGFRNHLEEFQDHLTWFRNRHNFKFGFHLTRVENDDFTAPSNLFGSLTFSNRFTSGGVSGQGQPYADFLLGIPTTSARDFPSARVDKNRWQYDFFATDDFKLNPRLTLNLGVRYELHYPWRENHGMTSIFDIGTGQIVVEDGALPKVSPLFPKGYVGIVEAKSLGLPGRTLVRTDGNNIVPRIGLAYRPWGVNTVFRAGYGLFYDVSPRAPNQGGVPFILSQPSYTNPTNNPDVILPRVFPATSSAGPTTVSIPAAVNPDIKIPYSMQYNFTIERQQWQTGFRITYVGTNTRHSDFSYNYNSPVPDTRSYVNKPRPFPQYPAISYFTNGAGHQYNALTLQAQRQMAHGLYFQSSWTWARDRYDLDRGGSLENPFDRRREVAVAPDIPTHRLTSNGIYQLPFGKGRHWMGNIPRWANLAVGGWEVSAIYSLYSGNFLTPQWTGSDPTGTAYTSSSTPAQVTIRPSCVADANLPGDMRSLSRWFDPSAFTPPAAGSFGSCAKGVIKGPGVNVWHVGFYKDFAFSDRGPHLRWELSATNIFNHPNWSNPATNISQQGSVGVITGVGGVNGSDTGDKGGARSFRMGVRLEW